MARVAEWIALAAIAGLLAAYAAALRPADRFGIYHDDSLYFSSAKALAEGRGYVIPSLPGEPRQSKYPILYPWLLSRVWRWNPSFPANLGAAAALSTAAALLYLAAAWRLLLGLGGVQRPAALAITALCAFHPVFLYLSGAVLSDMLFSGLALGAVAAAGPALSKHPRPAAVAATGILAGMATATRTLGVAVIAGIVLAALCRRLWRRAAMLTVLAAPFFLLVVTFSGPQQGPDGPPGWRQTWIYYTSYREFWSLSVPSLRVFGTMVAANLRYWLEGISSQCLFPPLDQASYAGRLLAVTLSAGILAGVVRQARRHGVRPVHLVFVLYSAATWLWNYPLMDRFLLPFLPLLYTGLLVEAGHLAGMLRRASRTRAEKVLAASFGMLLLAVGAQAVRQYLGGFRLQLHAMAGQRTALLPEKSEAYQWVRGHTDPAARFLAYEDVSLYLHTGRQAVRPMIFSSEAFYRQDEGILERDLGRIPEVIQASGARYWLVAEDDFSLETGRPLIDRRVAELQARFPVVFQSSRGSVRVLDLSKPGPLAAGACGGADPEGSRQAFQAPAALATGPQLTH